MIIFIVNTTLRGKKRENEDDRNKNSEEHKHFKIEGRKRERL